MLLVSVVLGGAASVGRQGFDALVQTRAPGASHGRAFARFETRFQLGWVAGAIAAVAVAIPTRFSLAIVALALIPAAVLYVRALREAHEAHIEDPFDPVEVARRRIEHAFEWHRRDLHRLAVTELAGVVDLARAMGLELDEPSIVRLDALRAVAVSPRGRSTPARSTGRWSGPVALVELLERGRDDGSRRRRPRAAPRWPRRRPVPTAPAATPAGPSGLAGRHHRRRRHRPLRRRAGRS